MNSDKQWMKKTESVDLKFFFLIVVLKYAHTPFLSNSKMSNSYIYVDLSKWVNNFPVGRETPNKQTKTFYWFARNVQIEYFLTRCLWLYRQYLSHIVVLSKILGNTVVFVIHVDISTTSL